MDDMDWGLMFTIAGGVILGGIGLGILYILLMLIGVFLER
jgi:hypothetical protein